MQYQTIFLQLQCNNLMNPLAVHGDDVLLSFWKANNEFNSFLLGLSSSEEKLEKGEYDIFCNTYENIEEMKLSLPSRAGERVFWHIKTEKYISETAYFDYAETFSCGKWISAQQTTNEICSFVKKFNMKTMPNRAKLLVCGLGFFDGEINGEKFDNHYYKPNFTDYKKRSDKRFVEKENYHAVYNTYDVTNLLKEGENILFFDVASGYFHNADRFDAPDWNYGDSRLKFELILYYENGETRIVSDEDCKVAMTGNFSTLYLGDRIDFRDRTLNYESVRILEDDINLEPSSCNDDIQAEVLLPIVIEEKGNRKVYDFGKNHTGNICCYLQGRAGTKVCVRYAEVANADGSLNFNTATYEEYIDCANIPTTFEEQLKAKKRVIQENTYILSGREDKVSPLFSWRCYRYVEITADNDFSVKNLTSAFIHMDIKKIGEFKCSEPCFNDIYEKYILTQLNNLHCGVATDCPHREKVAYTGDGHITAKSVLYNFEAESLYSKWLKDIIHSQSKDGFVPNSAPDMATGGGYFWGFAVMRLPEVLYQFTGRKEYLKRVYDSMVSWVEYLQTRHNGDYILFVDNKMWLLSDWLSPESVKINCRYFSTVCFYASAKILCQVYHILYGAKNEKYEALCEKIRKAINDTFFDVANMRYCNGVQGETVMALHYGIPEAEYVEDLKEAVRKHYTETTNYHLDTGIVLTPILLKYLTENGMSEIAYKIMTQTDYPSFAYMLQGETTLPEHWSKKWITYSFSDSDEFVVEGGDDVSHCHPMYGSVVEWLFEKVAGLDLIHLSDKVVYITPYFYDKVNESKASVELKQGKVSVEYTKNEHFSLKVKIPNGLVGKVKINGLMGDFSVIGKESYHCVANGALEVELDSGEWLIEG